MGLSFELPITSPTILVEMYEDGLFERLGEVSLEDTLEILTQEIAVDMFRACIGPSADDPKQTVFDHTLCGLILDRLDQIYRPRNRRRGPANPHSGYIYVIETPHPLRLAADKDDRYVLWVGVSEKPWETIQRATMGLGSRYLVKFLKELKKYSRDEGYLNFVWRKEEVLDAYKSDSPQPTHAIDQQMLWLPWRIIDDNYGKEISVAYYVKKFKEEGHPVKNGRVGRPKTFEPEILEAVEED